MNMSQSMQQACDESADFKYGEHLSESSSRHWQHSDERGKCPRNQEFFTIPGQSLFPYMYQTRHGYDTSEVATMSSDYSHQKPTYQLPSRNLEGRISRNTRFEHTILSRDQNHIPEYQENILNHELSRYQGERSFGNVVDVSSQHQNDIFSTYQDNQFYRRQEDHQFCEENSQFHTDSQLLSDEKKPQKPFKLKGILKNKVMSPPEENSAESASKSGQAAQSDLEKNLSNLKTNTRDIFGNEDFRQQNYFPSLHSLDQKDTLYVIPDDHTTGNLPSDSVYTERNTSDRMETDSYIKQGNNADRRTYSDIPERINKRQHDENSQFNFDVKERLKIILENLVLESDRAKANNDKLDRDVLKSYMDKFNESEEKCFSSDHNILERYPSQRHFNFRPGGYEDRNPEFMSKNEISEAINDGTERGFPTDCHSEIAANKIDTSASFLVRQGMFDINKSRSEKELNRNSATVKQESSNFSHNVDQDRVSEKKICDSTERDHTAKRYQRHRSPNERLSRHRSRDYKKDSGKRRERSDTDYKKDSGKRRERSDLSPYDVHHSDHDKRLNISKDVNFERRSEIKLNRNEKDDSRKRSYRSEISGSPGSFKISKFDQTRNTKDHENYHNKSIGDVRKTSKKNSLSPSKDIDLCRESNAAKLDNILDIVNKACTGNINMAGISRKYKIPVNCFQLKAPELESDTLLMLSELSRNEDNLLRNAQQFLAIGMVPVVNLANLFFTDSFNAKRASVYAADALELLGLAFHEMIKCRKSLMTNSIISKNMFDLGGLNKADHRNRSTFEDVFPEGKEMGPPADIYIANMINLACSKWGEVVSIQAKYLTNSFYKNLLFPKINTLKQKSVTEQMRKCETQLQYVNKCMAVGMTPLIECMLLVNSDSADVQTVSALITDSLMLLGHTMYKMSLHRCYLLRCDLPAEFNKQNKKVFANKLFDETCPDDDESALDKLEKDLCCTHEDVKLEVNHEKVFKIEELRVQMMCQMTGIEMCDLDNMWHSVCEEGTQYARLQAKNWIVLKGTDKSRCDLIMLYLLMKLFMKGVSYRKRIRQIFLFNDILTHCRHLLIVQTEKGRALRNSLDKVIVPAISYMLSENESETEKQKIIKLVQRWESSNIFSEEAIKKMKDPKASLKEYQEMLIEHYGDLLEGTGKPFSETEIKSGNSSSLHAAESSNINHVSVICTSTVTSSQQPPLQAHVLYQPQPTDFAAATSQANSSVTFQVPSSGFVVPPPNYSVPPPGYIHPSHSAEYGQPLPVNGSAVQSFGPPGISPSDDTPAYLPGPWGFQSATGYEYSRNNSGPENQILQLTGFDGHLNNFGYEYGGDNFGCQPVTGYGYGGNNSVCQPLSDFGYGENHCGGQPVNDFGYDKNSSSNSGRNLPAKHKRKNSSSSESSNIISVNMDEGDCHKKQQKKEPDIFVTFPNREKVMCSVCKLFMLETQKESHLAGKKHRSNLQNQKKKEVNQVTNSGVCDNSVSNPDIVIQSDKILLPMSEGIIKCQVCRIIVQKVDLKAHLIGLKHCSALRHLSNKTEQIFSQNLTESSSEISSNSKADCITSSSDENVYSTVDPNVYSTEKNINSADNENVHSSVDEKMHTKNETQSDKKISVNEPSGKWTSGTEMLNTDLSYPCSDDLKYYDLPAGLIVPLVKMKDTDYQPVDPAHIQLPASVRVSEHLINTCEYFYQNINQDSMGWEKGVLHEYLQAKQEIIEQKKSIYEEAMASFKRESRSLSPRMDTISHFPHDCRCRSLSPPSLLSPSCSSSSNGHQSRSSKKLRFFRSHIMKRRFLSPSERDYDIAVLCKTRRTLRSERNRSYSPHRRSVSKHKLSKQSSDFRRRTRNSLSPPRRPRRSPSPQRKTRQLQGPLRKLRSLDPPRKFGRSDNHPRNPSSSSPPRSGRRSRWDDKTVRITSAPLIAPPSTCVDKPDLSLERQCPLSEDNKGHQLLKKMGWSGKGLGVDEQGKIDPVDPGAVRNEKEKFYGLGIDLTSQKNKQWSINLNVKNEENEKNYMQSLQAKKDSDSNPGLIDAPGVCFTPHLFSKPDEIEMPSQKVESCQFKIPLPPSKSKQKAKPKTQTGVPCTDLTADGTGSLGEPSGVSAHALVKTSLSYSKLVVKWKPAGRSCPVLNCSTVFYSNREDFKRHWKEKHHEYLDMFACPLCEYQSVRLGDVEAHLKDSHEFNPSLLTQIKEIETEVKNPAYMAPACFVWEDDVGRKNNEILTVVKPESVVVDHIPKTECLVESAEIKSVIESAAGSQMTEKATGPKKESSLREGGTEYRLHEMKTETTVEKLKQKIENDSTEAKMKTNTSDKILTRSTSVKISTSAVKTEVTLPKSLNSKPNDKPVSKNKMSKAELQTFTLKESLSESEKHSLLDKQENITEDKNSGTNVMLKNKVDSKSTNDHKVKGTSPEQHKMNLRSRSIKTSKVKTVTETDPQNVVLKQLSSEKTKLVPVKDDTKSQTQPLNFSKKSKQGETRVSSSKLNGSNLNSENKNLKPNLPADAKPLKQEESKTKKRSVEAVQNFNKLPQIVSLDTAKTSKANYRESDLNKMSDLQKEQRSSLKTVSDSSVQTKKKETSKNYSSTKIESQSSSKNAKIEPSISHVTLKQEETAPNEEEQKNKRIDKQKYSDAIVSLSETGVCDDIPFDLLFECEESEEDLESSNSLANNQQYDLTVSEVKEDCSNDNQCITDFDDTDPDQMLISMAWRRSQQKCPAYGCLELFFTEKSMFEHWCSVHREKLETFFCNVCSFNTRSKMLMHDHWRDVHNKNTTQFSTQYLPNSNFVHPGPHNRLCKYECLCGTVCPQNILTESSQDHKENELKKKTEFIHSYQLSNSTTCSKTQASQPKEVSKDDKTKPSSSDSSKEITVWYDDSGAVCPVKDCKGKFYKHFKQHWDDFHVKFTSYWTCPVCGCHHLLLGSLKQHMKSVHSYSQQQIEEMLQRQELKKEKLENKKYINPGSLTPCFRKMGETTKKEKPEHLAVSGENISNGTTKNPSPQSAADAPAHIVAGQSIKSPGISDDKTSAVVSLDDDPATSNNDDGTDNEELLFDFDDVEISSGSQGSEDEMIFDDMDVV